jgi:signal transduction histidine kinase
MATPPDERNVVDDAAELRPGSRLVGRRTSLAGPPSPSSRTEHRRALPERAALILRRDGIARLALLALSERDVQRLLEKAALFVAQALDVDFVKFSELLPDGETLVSRGVMMREPKMLSSGRLGQAEDSQATYTLGVGSPVIVDDLRREERFKPSRQQLTHRIVGAVSVPLFSRTGCYGVLEVGTTAAGAVSSEEVVDFLVSAGYLVVAAVDRARAEAVCRFFAESGGRVLFSLDLRATLDALARLAVPHLADWCCLDLALPGAAIPEVAVAHIDSKKARRVKQLRKRLLAGGSTENGLAAAARARDPRFYADLLGALGADPEGQDVVSQIAEVAGFRGAIVAPLTARGLTFGTATLVAAKPGRLFHEEDVFLAEAFAMHAAALLDSARLFAAGQPRGSGLPRSATSNGIALLDEEVLQTHLLNPTMRESERLARVVEEIVFANELPSVRTRRVKGTCDVASVARRVVESFRDNLPPGCSLHFEEVSVVVRGENATIQKILTCLIDNAVKYSPDGGRVRIEIEARAKGVLIVVEDEGVGVPAAEQERVFEKFFRGEHGRSLGNGGAGLGLYICKELVSRLKGSIALEPGRSGGTRMLVELPFSRATPRPAGSNGPGQRRAGHRGG